VRVHLLLGHNEYTIFDWATPSLYGRFIKAGIEIHEYQKGLLHLKAMVVDEKWATLGSSNCDPLSFLVNHEANFVLVNHPIIKSIKSKIWDRARQHARQVSSVVCQNDELVHLCGSSTIGSIDCGRHPGSTPVMAG
jgi:cardiolipin synthase